MSVKNKKDEETERKKRDFKVGFICAALIVGAVAAVLLIILNF